VLGNVALDEEDALFRVQAAGDILGQLAQRPAAQICGHLPHGDGMHIHDAVDALVFVLKGDPVFDGAHIRPKGQLSAGLDAAENPFLLAFHNIPRCPVPERRNLLNFTSLPRTGEKCNCRRAKTVEIPFY
jgi:hypothetical protein